MSLKWCIYCQNYDITDIHSRGYRCVHHHRPMAIDESCPSFSDSLRSDKTVNEAISKLKKRGYNGKPDNSYWYVTSTVSRIACLGDNNKYMWAFGTLKENFLDITPQGKAFLKKYDIRGLYISKVLLENYRKNPEEALDLIMDEILPQLDIFVSAVRAQKYENALYYYESIMDFIEMHYKANKPLLNITYDETLNGNKGNYQTNNNGYCRVRQIV